MSFHLHFFFVIIISHPPRCTLYPYTTLFRSALVAGRKCFGHREEMLWSQDGNALDLSGQTLRSEQNSIGMKSYYEENLSLECCLLEKKIFKKFPDKNFFWNFSRAVESF